MESKDELKEINVKNCACYYFDDIIRDFDTNFDNILLDEKLHENISVYDISYKTSMGTKPLPIRFNKIDGFIKVHGGDFRHLVLFDYEHFAQICDKIKYFISEKVVLQIVIIIVFKKSELFHIILYLLKKY